MLFTGWEVRSVLGETVPEVLSTASSGTQTESTVSHNMDRPRPVNNILFFFFQLRFKSFRKMSLHSPTYVCWSRTRSCWWRTNEARDRLQTITKHYNMIFSSVIYIMTLTALFKNKERFLCLATQFIIWMSNKDKRIDELDIKSARKKIQQWFSSAERLVQSSGMKTAQRLCKKS